MDKIKYLKRLRGLLEEYDLRESEIEDICEDYTSLWEECVEKGMTDLEINDKLGNPDDIIDGLVDGASKLEDVKAYRRRKNNNKFVAISPFIALIAFFLLGFVANQWMYSWMVFLLIPVSAIVLNRGNDRILSTLTALSPFVALVLYFLLFAANGLWHPGWLIFLLIPAVGVLNDDNKLYVVIFEFLLLGGIALFLYLDGIPEYSKYAWMSFLPVVIAGLLNGDIIVTWNLSRDYILILVTAAIIYLAGGYWLDLWGYLWLVFLAIPVYAIWKESGKNERLIATMPFVAVTIFMTIGYFFGGWAYAWLAFLLIPMVAILKEG